MITTGQSDRVAEALEELADKLEEAIEARAQPLEVKVPQGPAPVVNVEAPARPRAWRFKVIRGSDDLITEVIATPKLKE
jgi:hypothetical protein